MAGMKPQHVAALPLRGVVGRIEIRPTPANDSFVRRYWHQVKAFCFLFTKPSGPPRVMMGPGLVPIPMDGTLLKAALSSIENAYAFDLRVS
jgi:hypothetical protein